MKLDRLLAKHHSMGRTKARHLIVTGRVKVDGVITPSHHAEINRFQRVDLDDEPVRLAERLIHLMLHKPVGIVSATVDAEHPTVIDLIDDPEKHTLHIAGRLDRSTSGLILLTNDGRWSKCLMDPTHKIDKTYLVGTRDPIPPEAVESFLQGFHFHTENITTLPARLEILGECQARLTLHEGRYHQIKRMFHRIGNRVTSLHRERIGPIRLPSDLAPGEFRALTTTEIAEFCSV